MRGLSALKLEFARKRPLSGYEVLLHMHLTNETVRLGETVSAGGAWVLYLHSGLNPPLPAASASVAAHGGRILSDIAEAQLFQPPSTRPPLLVVEGNGRIFSTIHVRNCTDAPTTRVRGISEHTSGGGRQVDVFERDGKSFKVPVVAVYRSALKAFLETGLGTSQSTCAALLRVFGVPLAGRRIAVVGFGHVGRGLAQLFRALGARVMIVETLAQAQLKAVLDGYEVVTLSEALVNADIAITTTGRPGIITAGALAEARAGIILGNVSNCPNEIDVARCQHIARDAQYCDIFLTPGGREFMLIANGIQINHVLEGGNPAELMDLSFSLHAVALQWLAQECRPAAVHDVPPALMERVATLCLEGWR